MNECWNNVLEHVLGLRHSLENRAITFLWLQYKNCNVHRISSVFRKVDVINYHFSEKLTFKPIPFCVVKLRTSGIFIYFPSAAVRDFSKMPFYETSSKRLSDACIYDLFVIFSTFPLCVRWIQDMYQPSDLSVTFLIVTRVEHYLITWVLNTSDMVFLVFFGNHHIWSLLNLIGSQMCGSTTSIG